MQQKTEADKRPVIGILMGSDSDFDIMREASLVCEEFAIASEISVISAHRTPHDLEVYATSAIERGLKVIIAGAGGAAHLPGVTAAMTVLPVIGVPIFSKKLNGQDSLYSIVQMPAGIPVGTLAVGKAGAVNAALLAIAILALTRPELAKKLTAFRKKQADKILAETLP